MGLPPWMRQKINTESLAEMQGFLKDRGLNTVCESGLCPNRGECYQRGVATFMILGDICTRKCRFCAVEKGTPHIKPPRPVDPDEPKKIANAVKDLKLKYVVITSVSRDDLKDFGAGHFVETISAIRQLCPNTKIEVLVPDFFGQEELIKTIVKAKPDVFSHNLETVPRLYHLRQGDYGISLKVLNFARKYSKRIKIKTGIMVGLGEKMKEVKRVIEAAKWVGVDIITIGQYLQPTPDQVPVVKFIHPKTFKRYENIAIENQLKVASGPFVRSSYYADKDA